MRLATDQEGALPKKVVRENPAIKGMPEVKDLNPHFPFRFEVR
jgi:hypothetical protein